MRCYLVLLMLLVALPGWTTVFRHGNTVIIPAGETIRDDLVISGGTLRILGAVTGNLVAAGGTIDCDGPVGGSLLVAGGTVNLRGPVADSVYAAGGSLDVHAAVGHNLTLAGGTVVLDAGTRVKRDLALSAGHATIGAAVGHDLWGNAGTLHLTNTAHIDGNLIATSGNPQIAAGAVVLGQRQVTQSMPARHAGKAFAGWAFWQLLSGIALFIAGAIFIATAPLLTAETEALLLSRPWASLLAGLIVLLLGLPLFVLLLVTLIGIPLAFIWIWLYGTALFLSPIFLAILVGQAIIRHPHGKLYTALLIGVALLIIARLIPVIGFLISLAAILFGLGSFVLALQARVTPTVEAV